MSGAALVLGGGIRRRVQVRHRYSVESASGLLGLGSLWPADVRRETLRRVRSLPTYEKTTDTVVVCWMVDA